MSDIITAPVPVPAPEVQADVTSGGEEASFDLAAEKAAFREELAGLGQDQPQKSPEEITRAEQRAQRRMKRQEQAKRLDEREKQIQERESLLTGDPYTALESSGVTIFDWAKKELAKSKEAEPATVEDKIAQLEKKLAEKERQEQEREVQARTQQIQSQVSDIISAELSQAARYPYLTAMMESGELAPTFAREIAAELLEMTQSGELPENVTADYILGNYEKYYYNEVNKYNKIAQKFKPARIQQTQQTQSATLSNKMVTGPRVEVEPTDPREIKEQFKRQMGWVRN